PRDKFVPVFQRKCRRIFELPGACIKPHLIPVIPSGVEAATQPESFRGEARLFIPWAQTPAKFAGYLQTFA
ncbi:MAG: hypothetical protein WA269_11420, partial [Candidatus Udaeobacter sp.]